MLPSPSYPGLANLRVLVVASAGQFCALPVTHVRETMRPLPVERFSGAPTFVLGLSVIRGATVPVVDLALLLGAERARSNGERYVTLKLDDRVVALSVGEVLGIRDLAARELSALPTLVDNAHTAVIAALTKLDTRLLRVLGAASVLPELSWAGPAGSEVSS
jgi:purine-binding chemotaxis protein CheW